MSHSACTAATGTQIQHTQSVRRSVEKNARAAWQHNTPAAPLTRHRCGIFASANTHAHFGVVSPGYHSPGMSTTVVGTQRLEGKPQAPEKQPRFDGGEAPTAENFATKIQRRHVVRIGRQRQPQQQRAVRLQARRSQHGSGWRLSVLRCHNKSNMLVRGTCSRAPRLDQGTAQLPVCWAASHGHYWRDHHRCYLRLHGALWRLGVCISNDQACVRGCCLPVACWAHPEPRQLGG